MARLRIIGVRAVEKLAAVAASPRESTRTRAAALRALEGIPDPRARDIALQAVRDTDEQVVGAAIMALRAWVTEGTNVLEALTTLALASAQSATVRLSALDAIAQLPRDVVRPLMQQVTAEIDRRGMPDDPLIARDWLQEQVKAPLSTLHDFIVYAREREKKDGPAQRRQDWLVSRGAAHAQLARRGSRVALYDLRETFDAAKAPLPLDFLTAAAAIGNAECLEPLARAWKGAPREKWWRDRLRETAVDIMRRERLTARSAAVKRLREKYPGFL